MSNSQKKSLLFLMCSRFLLKCVMFSKGTNLAQAQALSRTQVVTSEWRCLSSLPFLQCADCAWTPRFTPERCHRGAAVQTLQLGASSSCHRSCVCESLNAHWSREVRRHRTTTHHLSVASVIHPRRKPQVTSSSTSPSISI